MRPAHATALRFTSFGLRTLYFLLSLRLPDLRLPPPTSLLAALFRLLFGFGLHTATLLLTGQGVRDARCDFSLWPRRSYVENNRLEALTPTVGKLTGLTRLYLGSNQVGRLPPPPAPPAAPPPRTHTVQSPSVGRDPLWAVT